MNANYLAKGTNQWGTSDSFEIGQRWDFKNAINNWQEWKRILSICEKGACEREESEGVWEGEWRRERECVESKGERERSLIKVSSCYYVKKEEESLAMAIGRLKWWTQAWKWSSYFFVCLNYKLRPAIEWPNPLWRNLCLKLDHPVCQMSSIYT